MIQIIKHTLNDNSDASSSIDVMVCSSIPCAEEIILKEINKGFEEEWDSLESAAHDLNRDLAQSNWDKENRCFLWLDDGKGECYQIARINEREVNTKFQHIG